MGGWGGGGVGGGVGVGGVGDTHKGPVTRKMFPFGDVIMVKRHCTMLDLCWGSVML